MDPSPSQTRQSSSGSSSERNYDNIIASYWRQHRKPATYLSDHDQGYHLAPLQSSSSHPLPSVPSSGKRYGKRVLVFPEDDDVASSTAPAPLTPVAVVSGQNIFKGVGNFRENPLPALPRDAFAMQRPTTSFMSSTLAKLSNKQRKRSISNKSITAQKGQRQPAQKDSLGSSSDPSPPSSSGTDKIMKLEMDISTSSHSHSDGNKSISTGYEASYDSQDSKHAQPGRYPANQSVITNNSNTSNSNNGIEKISKKQRPIVPRIIIPDGSSINLSTPPSTPRQLHPSGPPIRHSQMIPWPYNLFQINERLRIQTGLPKVPTKACQSAKRAEHGRKRSSTKRTEPQQRTAQRDDGESTETTSRNEAPAQELPQSQQQHGSYIHESGETTAGTAGTEARTNEERGYLPEFGIMGLPMVYRAESLSSSEKYIWWDYDEHELGPGGVFSGNFWRRRFGTRAAVLNTLKHVATTSLGLLIIIAIALTALGKIKNWNQVSDSIPHSLDGVIMEAQVVVFKDMSSLQKLKVATASRMVTPDEQDALDQLEVIDTVEASRIPIWTNPIRKECFQKECDLSSFGKEFFAFLSPESFGIVLHENWPSLCNSCIEITRNQFVYKTKVRVLGDVQSCVAPASEDDQNRPSAPPPSFPLPPKLPLPLPPSLSPSLVTAPITTMTTTTTTTLILAASPTTSRKKHKEPKTPKDDEDLAKNKPHRPARHENRLHTRRRPTASSFSSPTDPTSEQRSKEKDHQDIKLQGAETAILERTIAPLQRRQAGPSSFPSSPSPSPSSPSFPSPSSSPSSSRVGLMLPPTLPDPASAPRLPYLIVDPATFDNLTKFDSRMAIQNMDFLQVQFRFILCDD